MRGTGAPLPGATFVPIVPPGLADNESEALKRDRLLTTARKGDPAAIETLWREYHLRLGVTDPTRPLEPPSGPRRALQRWQFTCPACGTTQTTRFKLKRYCSRRCRVVASRRRTAAVRRETGKILPGGAKRMNRPRTKGSRS